MLSKKSNLAALLWAVTFCCASPALAQNHAAHKSCASINRWINAFHPEDQKSKEWVGCSADMSKPVFTREGTLACPSSDSFFLAYNAMNAGWRYQQAAGVQDMPGEHAGEDVSPEYYGCTIYHDGVPAKITAMSFAMEQTDIGFVSRTNLRN